MQIRTKNNHKRKLFFFFLTVFIGIMGSVLYLNNRNNVEQENTDKSSTNTVIVNQVDDSQNVEILSQDSTTNSSNVLQSGDSNVAIISQSGNSNSSSVIQSGSGNTTTISQSSSN